MTADAGRAVPTRFDWERALKSASMPWHLKSLLLLVGTYMSANGRDARPTTASLCLDSGLSRARVFELLRMAEATGWLMSEPSAGKATLRIPAIPDPSDPPDGSSVPDPLMGENPSSPPDPSDPPDGPVSRTRPAHRTGGSSPPDGGGPAHRTQTTQDQATTKTAVAATAINAGTVVGAWVEAYRTATGQEPPSAMKAQVGREARTLLAGSAKRQLLVEAAEAAGRKGYPTVTREYGPLAARSNGHTTMDVDAILGPDTAPQPVPPPEVEDGPPERRQAWFREQAALRRAERTAQAKKILDQRQGALL